MVPERGRAGAGAWTGGPRPWLLVAAMTGASACRLGPTPVRDLERSPKLDAFTFIEAGKAIVLVAGVQAARLRAEEPFFPLLVGVANRGVEPPLRITRESFYLTDPEGKRTGLAPVSEVIRGYRFQNLDRSLLKDRGVLDARFDFYTRIHSSFFPLPGAPEVVHDRVELPRGAYLQDVLYFPAPPGGLRGRRLDLFLDCKPLEAPVFVTIEIASARK